MNPLTDPKTRTAYFEELDKAKQERMLVGTRMLFAIGLAAYFIIGSWLITL